MSFNESVQDLIDAIVCRRLDDPIDLAAAYRLRYDAYLREGAIAPNSSLAITDRFDDQPNNWTFGLYLDGRLASPIRLGRATSFEPDVPAMATFPEVVMPLLERGETVLDPTRFVLDARAAVQQPKLAYATLRIAWVVADHLDVDHVLASVRTEHQAFYRRFFGHVLVCAARPYPTLVKPLSLMVLSSREARLRGYERYPFLRSTRQEFDELMTIPGGRGPASRNACPRPNQAREDHAAVLG